MLHKPTSIFEDMTYGRQTKAGRLLCPPSFQTEYRIVKHSIILRWILEVFLQYVPQSWAICIALSRFWGCPVYSSVTAFTKESVEYCPPFVWKWELCFVYIFKNSTIVPVWFNWRYYICVLFPLLLCNILKYSSNKMLGLLVSYTLDLEL